MREHPYTGAVMPTFSIRSLLPAVLLASVGVFSGCDKGGDPKSGAKTEPESEAKPEPWP